MNNAHRKPEVVLFSDGTPGLDVPEETPAERLERKRTSARCGYVKRRLKNNERLTGDVLEFALGVIHEARTSAADELLDGMAGKLKAGKQLSDYEQHIMVAVLLLHKRLG